MAKPNTDTKHTILIVDDEPINLGVLVDALQPIYEVVVAKNGLSALKRLQSQPIDLILLDVVMPEMNGYEVLKKIKENEETKNIPVIFITSKNEVEEETYGLQLGAVDYIGKPFFLPIVLARVKTHIDLKMKNDLLESIVSIDGLTNIYNRRKFDEVLIREWKAANRKSSPLGLIMIDVDHFKNYNDHYGHAKGDECLRQVSRTINDCLKRPSDFLARYGGEEFAILLPSTDITGVLHIGEHIVAKVHHLGLPHEHSATSDVVTVSAGGACIVPGNGNESPISLIEQADAQLYVSKKGRNRMTVADDHHKNGVTEHGEKNHPHC